MSKIDWQKDLEKKVQNLVRNFGAEVRAHGDGDILADEPMVILHNGMIDIHVFKADNAGVVPTADGDDEVVEKPKKKTRKKTSSKKVDDESDG